MTSSPSPERQSAADARPGGHRPWPKLSRGQIWLTVGLVAVVIGVGVFALVEKSGGTRGASHTATSPAQGGAASAATSSGPTSTAAGTSGQAASAAAKLEIALRSTIGGCWDVAEPGAADGAYRQDYHHPEGKACAGPGWDIEVQYFTDSQAAARAARTVKAPQTAYTDEYNLIVLAGDVSAATRRAVASISGVRPA